VVALDALEAVALALLAVRRALPLVAELVRLAVVLALVAVRRALERVADAARRVSLRFRVAAAFWPVVFAAAFWALVREAGFWAPLVLDAGFWVLVLEVSAMRFCLSSFVLKDYLVRLR
jgi:hypothetical protein